MNYLLVMPKKLSSSANTTSIIFPLGIAYVSAALKKAGYSVFTSNLDFPEGETYPVLREAILANDIDVVCTGGLSLDCLKIKELIDTARKIKPGIITVVGGGIISSDPEVAMRVLGADIGVIGEGEVTMCELAHALDHGESFVEVPGLIFRSELGTLVTTSPRKEIADLDSIPFPDFDSFNYGQWVEFFGGGGAVLSDRSCPFSCTFCFHPTGQKYRQRSLDSIFEEIDYQVSKFHLKSVGLTSELFATSRERVLEFCSRISAYQLSWTCCLRVPDVDADMLEQMKKAGCCMICFGFESADNSILKSMRKGITAEQIARALDLSCDVGISTQDSNFIFGDINETWETVTNTLDFWWRYNSKAHINLDLIQTYPGTHLYEYACQNGIIPDKEKFLLDCCPIVNVSKLSAEEFHKLTSLIAELRMHPHAPAQSVRISAVQGDGNCQVEYVCRKCDASNTLSSRFWFTDTCHCPSCGAKNEVDTLRGASCQEDRFLGKLPVEGTVALWGAGGIYYKMIHQFGGLASDQFLLVDANSEQQGLIIVNKVIHSPDVIARDGIQTVIITALSRKVEIHQALRQVFPSVQEILVPSFVLDGTAIVPVLRPYHGSDRQVNTP